MTERGTDRRRPFHADGLRFSCTGCARCCENREGYDAVWVTRAEVAEIARLLGLPAATLRERYLVRIDGAWSLASRGDACVFLDGARCTVYAARPRQCRTWPFWPENLRRPVWEREVVPLCPGVGRGRFYSAREIRGLARATDDLRLPLPALPLADEV
jgi:Fe-S-cluster containining protein